MLRTCVRVTEELPMGYSLLSRDWQLSGPGSSWRMGLQMTLARGLPWDQEAGQATLGAVLIEPGATVRALAILEEAPISCSNADD